MISMHRIYNLGIQENRRGMVLTRSEIHMGATCPRWESG